MTGQQAHVAAGVHDVYVSCEDDMPAATGMEPRAIEAQLDVIGVG